MLNTGNTHQIAWIRYFDPQKRQYIATEVGLPFLSFNMDISRYKLRY